MNLSEPGALCLGCGTKQPGDLGKNGSAVRVLWKLDVNNPATMDESQFHAPDGALSISKTFWMNRYFVPRRNLVFQFL